MTNRMINNRLNKLAAIEAEMAALKDMAEALKDEIKDDMEERGLEEIDTGAYIVRFKGEVRNTLDSKKFKAEMPELAARYNKIVTARKFTYKTA